MEESGRIVRIFELLVEILTAKELETVTQMFLAKSSKLISALTEHNEKQYLSRQEETPTILDNLINLARPLTGASHANWILDSGASKHVTGQSNEFASYTPYPSTYKETIQTADGTHQPIKGVGTVKCSPSIMLSSVLHVPSFPVNLLSLSALVDQMDCRVSFDRDHCIIQERKTGKELGTGIRYGGLWYLDRKDDGRSMGVALASSMNEDGAKVMLQHCRLGHLSFDTMIKVFPEMMSKVDRRKLVCDACEYGKHTRSTYVSRGLRSVSPFMLIHSDVWTCPITSISGMRYFVTFIDCYSRVTWIYLIKHKSEVLKCFQNFSSLIENQYDARVKVLRTDNGTEYVNNEFGNFLSAKGILHQITCPDTPPQNRVAERKNRHILEVARSLMYTMNVPKFLWSEAVMTAVYLINRTPSRLLGWKTPYEVLRGTNEFIVPPKVFGCTCFVRDHRPSVGKLDPRAVKCIFVGYSQSQKGYTCWCPTERRLFVSMDVTFRESEPYYGEKTDLSSLFESDNPSMGVDDIEELLEKEDNQSRETEVITGLIPLHVSNSNVNERQENRNIDNMNARHERNIVHVYTRRKKTAEVEQSQQMEKQIEESQVMEQQQQSSASGVEVGDNEVRRSIETGGEEVDPSIGLPIALRKEPRSKAGKPAIKYGFEPDISNYISYESLSPAYRAFIASLQSARIPKDWKEAKQDPKWREAMLEELRALEKNKTWDLVELPIGKKAVSCKWVFTVKQSPEGKVERYKARLVARGYSQTYGIDYDETFAPVAKMSTVRTLISCASNFGWPLHQLDVKNAFLHGDLHEEVYMEIPPGWSKPETTGKVCKLKKSLYDLKQSPRAWFDRFKRALCDMGYKQCNGDHTLFYRHSGRRITVLAVYVDDIIITGDDETEIKSLKGNLSKQFDVKGLGQLRYFLGIEIARSPKGIVLSQRKYVLDLLSETGMLGCRPISTPIDPNHKLCAESGNPVNKESYQRLVGRLIYLCHTRPDISYAVSVVSRYMHDPRSGHLDAVYRILRYLKSSPGKD